MYSRTKLVHQTWANKSILTGYSKKLANSPLTRVWMGDKKIGKTGLELDSSNLNVLKSSYNWKVEASNAISEIASPRHQWLKTWLAIQVQVETPTRRSLPCIVMPRKNCFARGKIFSAIFSFGGFTIRRKKAQTGHYDQRCIYHFGNFELIFWTI